jgi:hypothetical protein
MSHLICRVRSFEIVSDYTLRVRFDDDSEQTIDFRPILAGELFGPLRDLEVFNKVRIDPDVYTLGWPNGADFDPATLHDWRRCGGVRRIGNALGARSGVVYGADMNPIRRSRPSSIHFRGTGSGKLYQMTSNKVRLPSA